MKKARENEEELILDDCLKLYSAELNELENSAPRTYGIQNSNSIQGSFIENNEDAPASNTPEGGEAEKVDPFDLLGLNIKSILETEVYLA